MHFATDDDVVFCCRVMNGEFPEVAEHLGVEGKKLVMPKKTTEILERAEVFSKREHFLDEAVEITIEDKEMTVGAQGDSGWIEEKTSIGYKGEKVSFVTNPSFLKEICNRVRKCELCENSMKFIGDNWQHLVSLTEK